MKRFLIICASIITAFTTYAADNFEVKLEGAFDFQVGARKEKKLETDNNLTTNQKNLAFFTQAGLRAVVSNTTDEGMKYGADITIHTTSRTKVHGGTNGSYLFTEAQFGKLELGSRQNAPTTMSQSAYNIAMGTGDDWGRYVNLNPATYTFPTAGGGTTSSGLYNGDVSFYDPIYCGFMSSKTAAEHVRTVTWYTPLYSGLQMGLSYSPDTANTGDNPGLLSAHGASNVTFYDKTNNYAPVNAKVAVKDLLGAGVTYEYNLSDGVDVKVAAGFERGKAAATDSDRNKLKLADHKIYNVGAVVSYGNWAVAASYADLGKSLTSAKYFYDSKKTKFYTGGVAYSQGPMGVSLTYFHNDKYKNKMDAYTLGTQYKVAPGLMPYFEVTSFKVKNRGYDMTNASKTTNPTAVNRKLNGIAYMFGTRVTF